MVKKKYIIYHKVPLSYSVLTNFSSIVAANIFPIQVIPNIMVRVIIDEYYSSIYDNKFDSYIQN